MAFCSTFAILLFGSHTGWPERAFAADQREELQFRTWTDATGSSLCFADGVLYLFGENGGKVALATCSPQGLEVKGTLSVEGEGPSWAHPVVIGGRLCLRYDSHLYCYNVRAEG
jgi:hypothetical protein